MVSLSYRLLSCFSLFIHMACVKLQTKSKGIGPWKAYSWKSINLDLGQYSPTAYIFFPRIDESKGDRIHSSLSVVHCFYNGYVGKKPVAWKKLLCRVGPTGKRILFTLKTVLNTIQSINESAVFTKHSQEHSLSIYPRFWKFKCDITSDWAEPYGLANQKLCHI